MPGIGRQLMLHATGGGDCLLINFNTSGPGATAQRWRWDGQKFTQIPMALADVTVGLVFRGPERHFRLSVRGMRKMKQALCGALAVGWQSAAPLGDHREGERLMTACADCQAVFDTLADSWH